MTSTFRFLALVFVLVTLFASTAVAGGEGNVIVARVSNDALVIWDATNDVARIVHDKLSEKTANESLTREGLRILASRISFISKSSWRVTLRIVYKKTAAVNSAYGTPTLAGVEKYAVVVLDPKDAFRDRNNWMKLAPNAPIPAWVRFKVIGRLPPR